MYETSLVQQRQPIQQLLCEHAHERCAETPELVLFDQLVEIDAQQFENKAQMLPVYERVLQTQDMVVVVLVELRVQLYIVNQC